MNNLPPERVNVLGVGVSAVNMQQALDTIGGWIEQRSKAYVVVCPVYTVMLCQRDPSLRAIVNQAGLVTPDGMPLVFLSRWMGHKHVQRVYGPDLMLAFSELASQGGYRQFYYGGAEGVPEKVAEVLARRFPGLQVAGTFSPPFRDLTAEEEEELARRISAARPDVVWVALGSPKQDYWMARFRELLDAPVLIGVGAAFDFLSGRVPQAPGWMRGAGLEWLFRLGTEPRRLWRRYLIYSPQFVLAVLLQRTGLRRFFLDD
jgi:N-acetylglucosaminyldiphosphoundecaprenol N-acetyl-beta-D-mannosaminyltransferase